ncbi:MAG: hypothetical protein AB7P02_29440 [Alphaproteobacteria bacterium]
MTINGAHHPMLDNMTVPPVPLTDRVEAIENALARAFKLIQDMADHHQGANVAVLAAAVGVLGRALAEAAPDAMARAQSDLQQHMLAALGPDVKAMAATAMWGIGHWDRPTSAATRAGRTFSESTGRERPRSTTAPLPADTGGDAVVATPAKGAGKRRGRK